MKKILLSATLLLVGCLGVNSGNPMKREAASVSPVASTAKATTSAICTRCDGLTNEDLDELRWMLDPTPMLPPSYEYEEY